MNDKLIWNQDNRHDQLEPLSELAVIQAEKTLNVKLPELYIELLKKQNGGSVHYNAFPVDTPNAWASDHVPVDHLWGIGEGRGIMESKYLIQEWSLPERIVLLSGEGHSWIALDYRHTEEEPPVLYIEPDLDLMIELASNFETFINGLYINETNFEEIDVEDEQKDWTHAELSDAISSENEQEMMLALDALVVNAEGNESFIEQLLISLLKKPDLDSRQLAANYAYHFNELGLLSPASVEEITDIISKDHEIAYFVEMYFNKKGK